MRLDAQILAAGITDFRFNDLRHTFASHLAMAGTDLLTLKDLLGHTNIQMTTRCSHLYQEHKAQAVTRLDNRFAAETQAESPNDAPTVSPELKEAMGTVEPMDLAQNRHISFRRKGRGLEILSEKRGVENGQGRNRTADTRIFSIATDARPLWSIVNHR